MLNNRKIKEAALAAGADKCGIAPVSRLRGAPKEMNVNYLFPEVKSVIGLVFRIPRGVQRGIEEGTQFFQYPSMAYGGINEIFAPYVLYHLGKVIEDEGYEAFPYRNTGARGAVSDMDGSEGNTVSPEEKIENEGTKNRHRCVQFTRPVREDLPAPDLQFQFRIAAVACGLGEIGWSKMLLTPEFGPLQRLAFRVLRGAYRGIEEGSTFYQYTTMGVENMEETVMPMALLRVANLLEEGFVALPQRRHQQIVPGEEDTSPEMVHQRIYRGKKKEVQMDFLAAAVACGLGERGLHNALLTEDFGPMVRYCFLLTNAALSPEEIPPTSLCDRCEKCVAACPGKAIDATGRVDPW